MKRKISDLWRKASSGSDCAKHLIELSSSQHRNPTLIRKSHFGRGKGDGHISRAIHDAVLAEEDEEQPLIGSPLVECVISTHQQFREGQTGSVPP